MILQALNSYYNRRQSSPDPKDRLPSFGLENKEIQFILELDSTGSLINILDTRSKVGKKNQGQIFLVPKGAKKSLNTVACVLWGNAEYVLGLGRTPDSVLSDTEAQKKASKVVDRHACFIAKVKSVLDSSNQDSGVLAVDAFLFTLDLKKLESFPSWLDIAATNPNLSFRLHGDAELVCQRPAVVLTNQTVDDEPDGVCLVSGLPATMEILHSSTKGVRGAQPSGASLVSFNADSFCSYGKKQGTNAPVGKAASFAYSAALDSLLSWDSRHKILVGETSTVFWAEEEHDLESVIPDIFGEPPKDDPTRGVAALRQLITSVKSGKFAKGDTDTKFYILGLSPNAGRLSVRFFSSTTAKELYTRILTHFKDISVCHRDTDPEYLSIFRLLSSLSVLGKIENLPPNLEGEIMRSIIGGFLYPVTLLNLAVQRCRAEEGPTYARAAVLKGYLNRHIRRSNKTAVTIEKEFQLMLDSTNAQPGYLMGRLFAVLERIQEKASGGGLNSTIKDRYYGSASATPATAFTMLLKLSPHHLSKMHKGQAVNFEKLLAEIIGGVKGEFPRTLNMYNQGCFAIGYYHQRQAFFTKSIELTDSPATSDHQEE